MSARPVVWWFRRDLRLADNLALNAAVSLGKPIIPLFVFDPAILRSNRFSHLRFRFMLNALQSLEATVQHLGGSILMRHGNPTEVVPALISEVQADALYFNSDYTPYARKRDSNIITQASVPVKTFHDRLLAPPGSVLKDDGTPYTVFTPFKNKWRTQDKSAIAQDFSLAGDSFYNTEHDNHKVLASVIKDHQPLASVDLPKASEDAAQERLRQFTEELVFHYAKDRDRLGNIAGDPQTGTSGLSPYVRFGLLSPRQIYWAAHNAYTTAETQDKRDSVSRFIDEIIWHEFYTHILWHFPRVKEYNFRTRYDVVEWRNAADFEAWKAGKTGYPVVDAAMRQLKATGWMSNRARMIVASFLTKHLLIRWQDGELHFMNSLIDGDLAANNGGWQWAAGTGTDAQPFFRIFNPVTQSRQHDPDGSFIRKWIPELRDIPTQFVHEPWTMENPPADYPPPIVDHKVARQIALEAFSSTRQ